MDKISVKLETRSAHDCFKVVNVCLSLAENAAEDWEVKHHCTTGIVFTAFTIEAMLNHFGKIYYSDWNNTKRDRKSMHKMLFDSVNLPGYLGSKNYQLAKSCFDMRDAFAHGRTFNEEIEIELPANLDGEMLVRTMTSIPMPAQRNVNYEVFHTFIKVTRSIEQDIQANGFYPASENDPHLSPQKLRECPLSVTGISLW